MKLIVYKKDIEYFLNNFLDLAEFDQQGNKHYFLFQDHTRNGDWTLMYYKEEKKWTIHGKGLDYCDEGEQELERNELILFLFKNRKYINNELRRMRSEVTS
ncbi:hypothetical protein [Bacillus sp. USDA818B3_A]|uniref:hypothetical protein n=1 Tax=Bacillus sp. USDA818B3_A TaxID=2698834 RepID=UPI00136A2565|nr:hypothetical protein [Bacillus sp. USDA818B3_A]